MTIQILVKPSVNPLCSGTKLNTDSPTILRETPGHIINK
jgi:hypothetical protein